MIRASRELDALVAEKVMGCKVTVLDSESGLFDCGCGAWEHQGSYFDEGDEEEWSSLARYSTDIAAAWKVVAAMQAKNWAWIIDNMQDYLGSWQAHFEYETSVVTAESENVCEAICLAALKAVGVSEEEIKPKRHKEMGLDPKY